MGISRENLGDPQVLHDDKGREIGERDVRLIVILLPQLTGSAELLSGTVNQLDRRRIDLGQQGVQDRLCLSRGRGTVKVVDELAQDEVRRDVLAALFRQDTMLLLGRW
jgi:hypothetical protein